MNWLYADNDAEFESDSSEEDDNTLPVKKLKKPVTTDSSLVKKTDVFEAVPPIVHFSGGKPGDTMTFTLSIVNISSSLQRMQIIPPSSDIFKIDFNKNGSIAAGLSQKITITYRPKDFKYYSDVLRIRGTEKTLLVPLHGYPLINKLNFPSHINFGNTPISEPTTKVSNSCSHYFLCLICLISFSFYYVKIDVDISPIVLFTHLLFFSNQCIASSSLLFSLSIIRHYPCSNYFEFSK